MEAFQRDFGDMKDASQLEKLHAELKPFLLRRMKEDVEKSLKPKEETVINVELTAVQKKYYRAIYDHNTAILYGFSLLHEQSRKRLEESPLADERNDGAAQVLQPSLPHPRRGERVAGAVSRRAGVFFGDAAEGHHLHEREDGAAGQAAAEAARAGP